MLSFDDGEFGEFGFVVAGELAKPVAYFAVEDAVGVVTAFEGCDEALFAGIDVGDRSPQAVDPLAGLLGGAVLGGAELGDEVVSAFGTEEPFGQELECGVGEVFLSDPDAGWVAGEAGGGFGSVVGAGLTGHVGVALAALAEHSTLAEGAEYVGAKEVAALGLRVGAVGSGGGAGPFPLGDQGTRCFEGVEGDEGLVGGLR